MILRRKISQPVKFSSSSKFNKSFRGSPIGREEKHILRERLSKVKRRVFVCGRRCVTPYSNFWTDRFSSSFLPRVLHTVQHRSRPESADDVTFGLKQIRGVAKGPNSKLFHTRLGQLLNFRDARSLLPEFFQNTFEDGILEGRSRASIFRKWQRRLKAW